LSASNKIVEPIDIAGFPKGRGRRDEKSSVTIPNSLIAAVLAMSLALCGLSHASQCDDHRLETNADRVASARSAMLAIPIRDDGSGTLESSEARQAIVGIKNALLNFAVDYMTCAPATASTGEIQGELERRVHAVHIAPGNHTIDELPPDAFHYGYDFGYSVKLWPSHKLGIVATFSIACGNDAVLAMFEREAGSWRQVMTWSSEPYTEVSGAFGTFDYAVSPPDDAGHWYVLTKNIAPWCSSTWSSIRYAILRPDPQSLHPRVAFSGKDFMWYGNEDYGRPQGLARPTFLLHNFRAQPSADAPQ
jgi:hypothetical protein